MMKPFAIWAKVSALVVSVALAAGCGGKQVKKAEDPRVLFSTGRFKEARLAALSRGGTAPADRAVIALSTTMESPSIESQDQAVVALTEGADESQVAAAAAETLKLAFDFQDIPDANMSLALVEVALGALGQGPVASPSTKKMPAGEATRAVAADALERIHIGLTSANTMTTIDTGRISDIWKACFELLGASLEIDNDFLAWKLFRSIGGIAFILSKAAPNDQVTVALIGYAVEAVESNPSIAIAARCDLASPFDDLKAALIYDREMTKRLEGAVASAAGCSRGAHAPTQ